MASEARVAAEVAEEFVRRLGVGEEAVLALLGAWAGDPAPDLTLILDLADSVHAPMPQTLGNLSLVEDTIATLGPDRDTSAVAERLRALAGEGMAH